MDLRAAKFVALFAKSTRVLEFGASRLALAAFRQRGGRIRLDSHEAVELIITAGCSWAESACGALLKLRELVQRGGPVTVVLPPHLVLTKLIRVPPIEPAKRARIIAFEAEQNLPYALTDLVWDNVVAAEHDQQLEVLLAAARLEAVESLCAAMQAAGFEPRGMLPSPLATLAAFRLVHKYPQEPALVLNLGARSTTLLCVAGPRFVTRTMVLGGPTLLMSGGVETLATRLAQEVTRSVLFFRRQGDMANPACVHLTGGGAALAGLGEALAAKLKLPVDRLDVHNAIEICAAAVRDDAAGTALNLSDLAGAAAIQLRPGQPVMNLLPPRRRHHETRRRRLPWLAAAVVLAGMALLPSLFSFWARAAAVRHQTTAVVREAAPWSDDKPAKSLTEAQPIDPTDDVPTFDLELLEVKREPYPLQFAGYLGEPGDYFAAFVSPNAPETLLARRGHRLERFGLTLKNVDVRKIELVDPDGMPGSDVAALAVLLDEKTGEEVILDSRVHKLADTPLAVLRLSAARAAPLILREGESFASDAITYRIERIQLDPPEVVVARQGPGLPRSETRILRPVETEDAATANEN